MNRRSFLKRASLAVGAASISLSMLRAPKPKKVGLESLEGEIVQSLNPLDEWVRQTVIQCQKDKDRIIIEAITCKTPTKNA